MNILYIGIVEDQDAAASQLEAQLEEYKKEKDLEFQLQRYRSGEELVEKYDSETDILLLDIEMPGISGMEAAKMIREKDRNVIMIFVTNLAQYAIKGYEVGAMDYLLKPVSYAQLAMRMDRAMYILRSRTDAELVVNNTQGVWKLKAREILYVEVTGHWLHIKTMDQTIRCLGSLSEMERKLVGQHFARCSSGFLVNMAHIRQIMGDTVILEDGGTFPISRSKKRTFMQQVTEYFGRIGL